MNITGELPWNVVPNVAVLVQRRICSQDLVCCGCISSCNKTHNDQAWDTNFTFVLQASSSALTLSIASCSSIFLKLADRNAAKSMIYYIDIPTSDWILTCVIYTFLWAKYQHSWTWKYLDVKLLSTYDCISTFWINWLNCAFWTNFVRNDLAMLRMSVLTCSILYPHEPFDKGWFAVFSIDHYCWMISSSVHTQTKPVPKVFNILLNTRLLVGRGMIVWFHSQVSYCLKSYRCLVVPLVVWRHTDAV